MMKDKKHKKESLPCECRPSQYLLAQFLLFPFLLGIKSGMNSGFKKLDVLSQIVLGKKILEVKTLFRV